jgi:hypothetical protein
MSKLRYSDVVKNGNIDKLTTSSNTDDSTFFKYNGNNGSNERTTTNKPKYMWRRDSNYDNWEHAYFLILLKLRNIFIERIIEIRPEMELYLNSEQFFYIFNQFIYENSSTIISNFLEPLTPEVEDIYSKYKEMRHHINEYHG